MARIDNTATRKSIFKLYLKRVLAKARRFDVNLGDFAIKI